MVWAHLVNRYNKHASIKDIYDEKVWYGVGSNSPWDECSSVFWHLVIFAVTLFH
jgi:hypothetical protein